MLEQQAKLSHTQQQLATGRRILTPAEDPSGSAKILGLNQVISVTEQYLRNADVAESRLELEETALDGIMNIYQRARELTIQGSNDTLGTDERKAIAVEMRELLDELLSLANRKDANGEFIFSGFSGNQPPVQDNGSGTYTYLGDQGQRQIRVGPSREVSIGDNGYDVFFNINNSTENAFSAIYTMITGLETNNPNPAVLQDFDAVMNNINIVRSRVGARLNSIEEQKQVNESLTVQGKTLLSETEDVDFAEAVTRLNLQLTGLQAAQQSYTRIQGLSLFNFL